MSDSAYRDITASSLADLPQEAWTRNLQLHLPLSGGARPWICRGISHPLLVLLPNSRAARDFASDAAALSSFVELPRVEMLPEEPPHVGEDGTGSSEATMAERGEVMLRWQDEGGALAATAGALMGPFSVGGDSISLSIGPGTSRSRLIEWLDQKGYERADIVWSPGQYTYRGGIVDLFDPKDPYPIRIEYFDDDIESMRYFATDTQRSLRSLSRVELRTLAARRSATLDSFFPPDAHIVMFEPADIENSADNYLWMRRGSEGSEARDLSWEEVARTLRLYPRVRVSAGIERADISTGITGLPNFRGRSRDLEAYCDSLTERGASIRVVSEADRSLAWAESRGASYRSSRGSISEGFFDSASGAVFIGDIELSGVTVSASSSERRAPREWAERIAPGQWVVHEDYGLGRFIGTERIDTPDGAQEYLVIEYADARRLKIPVMHFHKISRYIGAVGTEPTPDSLRGGRWRKSAAKAREQAEEAARYLVGLYAKRETTQGRAFAGDPEQEEEFRSAFPYRETSDQLRAIEEVYRDMSRSIPMDRLLIGDVGFGKTEVAMRAAARCVFDGMQVAVMAPTTLLAQQHFETFSARFDQFGARVEVVSRFVSAYRQKKILAAVESGAVDILIGTHRLLGKDVKFKGLGLLIVDEEHRFGVMHKERLKEICPDVDVLMLSATPIPRSLRMSMSGLRDMSLLQTPPRRRVPVITASAPWSEELVRDAVIREKNRGGQVFYVHNRVKTIEREAMMLRRLFPGMAVSTVHGQMDEGTLRDAMDSFARGKIDILVCTTIVESGLDLPRANTLIVSDSQDLGLAQMYQLRGRVGRRDEQAFAYFFYPAEIRLNRDAAERLDAISAFGDFGAGYELAKRDLEIRGGGELVGTAQHGSVIGVGFERYCDLLEEAILREKGEWHERTAIEVTIPTAIPIDYLPPENMRVALYRRILWMNDTAALTELREETRDRFGPIPPQLAFMFDLAVIRIIGPDRGVRSVTVTKDETAVVIEPSSSLAGEKAPPGWFRLGDKFIGRGGLDPLQVFVRTMMK